MASEKAEMQHARLLLAGEKGEAPEHAKVTPEAEARRRDRSNKPFIARSIYFNRQASKDGILHFVDGIGDLNPLYRDEEYAKKTKYQSIIAPPCYLYTVQWSTSGAGLPGVHGWWTGGEWEWYKPIFAGDEFNVVCVVRELVGKEGKMGGGRTWLDYGDNIFVNQKGEIVGKERSLVILAERGASGSAGKVRAIPKPEYSSEDWIKILELYDKEELRGAEPRYWEDVEVGEKHPDFSGADIGNICG